ncbi:hypothetical protein KVR01_011978 [Diaporthe batatas]|uniref:uncharacterized protein n=1 Tax=Diaporthe batatas TaxID=748121 RepID=UPI001D053AE6|nr:uncharacterized protein KVR01_011978 [Diaporthe batatas]KAG8158217.1 hypothetical protein KVR01_011978 [Diaporthe batatas]
MEQFVTTFSATGRQPKETCKQCRFRKVRCDGQKGDKGCGDCDRLKFACSFVGPVPPPTPTSTTEGEPSDHPSPTSDRPVERRRTSKACIACRQHKVRCSSGTPCLACKKRGVTCVYGTDGRRKSSRAITDSVSKALTPTESVFPPVAKSTASTEDTSNASPTPTTPEITSLQPVAVSTSPPQVPALLPPNIQVLVEFYFNHVYPLSSYAFLHPETTIHHSINGQLETSLSYAIVAIASYHHGSSQRKEQAELSWVQAAEDLIWKNLESPSVSRLQALLLVTLYRVETGAFQRAFMLSALAARAAAAMRLNHERDESTGNKISREVRRRVMWTLKLVERYFSTGLPEFELCPVESIYLELPCWEQEFSDTRTDGSTERTPQSCDFGSYHLSVRLEMLRRDLMKLNRSLSLCDTTFPQLSTVMHEFEQHLARIEAELPGGPTLTAERISSLLDSPWLPRQILVHLSFHHSQCDLYRLLVRGYREAAPAVVLDAVDGDLLARAEQLCLQHATAIVDILAILNQVSHRAQLLEFDTAICGYHATRLLLFIAQSSRSPSRPSEEWALSRAELCLAALRRFFPSSRLARPVLEEMKRAISVYPSSRAGAGTAASSSPPTRLASPGPTASSMTNSSARNSAAGLSAAARVRQRLAIHSLLRQADFPDGDDQPPSPEGARHGSLSTAAATKVPSPRLPGIATLDIMPTVPSSTGYILPPRRTLSPPYDRGLGSEPWQSGWLDGGFAADGWESPRLQQAAGGGGGPPSFSFPWLQRWEGANAVAGEMMAKDTSEQVPSDSVNILKSHTISATTQRGNAAEPITPLTLSHGNDPNSLGAMLGCKHTTEPRGNEQHCAGI